MIPLSSKLRTPTLIYPANITRGEMPDDEVIQTHPELLEKEQAKEEESHGQPGKTPAWFWLVPLFLAVAALVVSFKVLQGDNASASTLSVAAHPVSGGPAPNFTAQTLDGKHVSLADFRGKTVLLNFWATWCPPCRSEMPDMEKVYRERLDKDVVILAIDVQEADVPIQGFIDRFSITFPILMDVSGDIAKLYGIQSLPSSFFIDKQGRVTSFNLGAMNESAIARRIDQALELTAQ